MLAERDASDLSLRVVLPPSIDQHTFRVFDRDSIRERSTEYFSTKFNFWGGKGEMHLSCSDACTGRLPGERYRPRRHGSRIVL